MIIKHNDTLLDWIFIRQHNITLYKCREKILMMMSETISQYKDFQLFTVHKKNTHIFTTFRVVLT